MKKNVLTVLTLLIIAMLGVFLNSKLKTKEESREILSIERPAVIITSTNRYQNPDGSITVTNEVKNQSENTLKILRIELQQFDNSAIVKDRQYYTVDINLKPGESTNISSSFIEKEENKGMLISPVIREIIMEEEI